MKTNPRSIVDTYSGCFDCGVPPLRQYEIDVSVFLSCLSLSTVVVRNSVSTVLPNILIYRARFTPPMIHAVLNYNLEFADTRRGRIRVAECWTQSRRYQRSA